MGQKTPYALPSTLTSEKLQKQQDTTPKLLCAVLSCRETNMKVRQSVSVTSELGDPNNLALFDGEIEKHTYHPRNLDFHSSFLTIKVNNP